MLDVYQVAGLACVGPDAVRRAVCLTRQGLAAPGSPNYLPRASRVVAGFRRDDVVAWLRARGQLGPAFAKATAGRRGDTATRGHGDMGTEGERRIAV